MTPSPHPRLHVITGAIWSHNACKPLFYKGFDSLCRGVSSRIRLKFSILAPRGSKQCLKITHVQSFQQFRRNETASRPSRAFRRNFYSEPIFSVQPNVVMCVTSLGFKSTHKENSHEYTCKHKPFGHPNCEAVALYEIAKGERRNQGIRGDEDEVFQA